MRELWEELIEKLWGWVLRFIVNLPNLMVAMALLLIAVVVSVHVRSIVQGTLNRLSRNQALNRFLARLVQVGIIVVGGLIALNVMKWDDAVFSVVAGIGIIGLALAFAFQDIAANFIAGTVLVFQRDRPFKVGDVIETNDNIGVVQEINLRDSMIRTFDGRSIFIPNKLIFENAVSNYSFLNLRRVDLEVGISYGDDLTKVRAITLQALQHVPGRVLDREVEFFYEEFGDSSINFSARIWIHYKQHKDYVLARSEAIIAVKRAFDENDITIPFPIRTLDFGIKGGATMAEMLQEKN